MQFSGIAIYNGAEYNSRRFEREEHVMDTTLKSIITELEDLFEVFNEKYFDSGLSRPVITVSPDTTKRGMFGWCTEWKAWQNKDSGEGYYEINVCAEHLSRPFADVAGTMLHEMVHLFDVEQGVKDTSRSGTYHNVSFKAAAEAHGLNVEKDPKYGWSKTVLNADALKETNNYMAFIGKDSFSLYREAEPKEEKKGGKKGSSIKYVCPMCGAIIRATKKVRVICADCGVEFAEE